MAAEKAEAERKAAEEAAAAAAKAKAEPAKLVFTHHGPDVKLTEDGTQDTLTSLSLDPRG